MTDLVWLVPAVAALIFLGALYRLGQSAKLFERQSNRLQKAFKVFRETDHSASLTPAKFLPTDLKVATANRKAIIKGRTKSKEERQRRLVKRLRDLKSKESE